MSKPPSRQPPATQKRVLQKSTAKPTANHVSPDPLQVAAQLYPWIYMTTTLEATFNTAESSAQAAIAERTQELAAQEADISSKRIRFESERTLALIDELTSSELRNEVPRIMLAFVDHEQACKRAVADALALAARGHGQIQVEGGFPLRAYDDCLASLETLYATALLLDSSISRLPLLPQSKVLPILSALLPLLRARATSISYAQELIKASRDNIKLGIRLQSLECR